MTKNIRLLSLALLGLNPSLHTMNVATINNSTCSLPTKPLMPIINVKPLMDEKQKDLLCVDKNIYDPIRTHGFKVQRDFTQEKITKYFTSNYELINKGNNIRKRSRKERKLTEKLKGKTTSTAYNSVFEVMEKLDFSQPLSGKDLQSYAQLAVNIAYRRDMTGPNSLINQWIKKKDTSDNIPQEFLQQMFDALKKNKSYNMNSNKAGDGERIVWTVYSCISNNINKKRTNLRIFGQIINLKIQYRLSIYS